MNIIKIYTSFGFLLIICLSRIISYSINSFVTFVNNLVYNRIDNFSRTIQRNIAERSPSRSPRKRAYDFSLTEDEVENLISILHLEALVLSDIICTMIQRLNEETGSVNVDGLVRDKILQRSMIESTNYPNYVMEPMQIRLTEQVGDIVSVRPLSKDIILQKYELCKMELDESVHLVLIISKQHTEEEAYEILNNLQLIGELLNTRLRNDDIIVDDITLSCMALRARRRAMNIINYYLDRPSFAKSN
ncbi:hypothetical protein, conserved [Plasmodium gonderi]|uniref:Gametocyte associated protein n=1 Tax=Plasmodium gonderi TaxID=77519 RepID=A0A1Y1JKZ1_PLAGO|nr:hypothetical protein, conserved [Plasmodium gonderi]GAW83196.1 hypothetical protein, conserved [Plasmodium gonderi]